MGAEGIYVVLGNCLAAGADGKNITTPYPEHFRIHMESVLGEPLQIRDFSRLYGMETAEIARLVREDEEVRRLLRHSRVVTFNAGENELLAAEAASAAGHRRALGAALFRFQREYPALVDAILDAVPRRQAIVRTFAMYNPLPFHPQARYVRRFNHVILRTAGAGDNRHDRPIPVAPLHQQFTPDRLRELLGSDRIHPSTRGHREIAVALARLGTATA